MGNLSIRPLNTGTVAPAKGVFYHELLYKVYNPPERMDGTPVFCFLVEGGDKPLLVDTGISDVEHAYKYHGSTRQPEGTSILEHLKKLGYAPDDIGYVVLTHLHWDHCFYLKHFTKAHIFAHPKEIAFANDPIPMSYMAYEHPIIGVQNQFGGLRLELVEEGAEIIPGVTVIETPGHSPGHITVCVSAPSGEYLCVGDAIMHRDNLKEVKDLYYNVSPPGRFSSLIETWKSLEKLKASAKAPEYLLLAHDKELISRIEASPVLS
ncbi:MBL fold hydrolase [Synergistales bacterium]|nr:MBL fold hydrolase [Synergistales bacterium]